MKRIIGLAAVTVLLPAIVLAAEPERSELLGSPRYVEKKAEPSFGQLTAEELQDQLEVISSRSYAVFGFNNLEVQIYFPKIDNSVYAATDFAPARLVDSKGNEVEYERERGIFDYDTHHDELRFAPAEGKTPVEFARAEGTITLRYPVRMKTVSLKNGDTVEGVKVTIDGPFVSWTGKKPELPGSASFGQFEQWRAYDKSGRRLEKHQYQEFSMKQGLTTETYAYWGDVKEVRVDVVDEWAEIEITYSLPSIDPLPDSRIGTAPKDTTVKATPGGKVTMKVAGAISKDEAMAQLKELGFRKFDANSFVLAATRGKADALKLFLAAGMPVDIEAHGRTALMSAAMVGRVEAGKVLIEAGADVNKRDSSGSPPLFRLVMKCNATELVQAFIDAGADLTVKMRGGVTLLQMAEMTKCTENAKVLKAAGAR